MKIDFLKRCKQTYKFWISKRTPIVVNLEPEVRSRAIVEAILVQRLRPKGEQQVISLKATADEIVRSLGFSDWSLEEKGKILYNGTFSQAFWFHAQLAGLTATWEFNVRLFALKLNISQNVPIDSKSKKNRALKSIQQRKLSDTIKEINKVSKGKLNLKLEELSGLRDSIVHCNPQGMKPYSRQVFGRNIDSKSRGEVVVMTLHDSKVFNLGDLKEEADIETQDLFGWFLEVFNSKLPKIAFDEFSDSIKSLQALTHFAALSFDGREEIFRKFIFSGVRLSVDDINAYKADYDLIGDNDGVGLQDFFDGINGLLK